MREHIPSDLKALMESYSVPSGFERVPRKLALDWTKPALMILTLAFIAIGLFPLHDKLEWLSLSTMALILPVILFAFILNKSSRRRWLYKHGLAAIGLVNDVDVTVYALDQGKQCIYNTKYIFADRHGHVYSGARSVLEAPTNRCLVFYDPANPSNNLMYTGEIEIKTSE